MSERQVEEETGQPGDDVVWVDPRTGEIVQAGTEGALLLDGSDLSPEVVRQDSDSEWLGDYVTRRLVELDAQEMAFKLQAKKAAARLVVERRLLADRYGERLQRVVSAKLAGGKRKSADFAYGSAGWRKQAKIEVSDEAAAIKWAKAHAPSALKVTVALLKSNLPKGTEVPGVTRTEVNNWFVRGA